MIYTIEKITTLIGARRFGEENANIGFFVDRQPFALFPRRDIVLCLEIGA